MRAKETDTTKFENWDVTKLTGEQGRDIVYGNTRRFYKIENKIVDTSRWSEHHEHIFEDLLTGKFYRTYYSQGLTEMQEERAFEEEDFAEVTEVTKVPIESYKWEPVK